MFRAKCAGICKANAIANIASTEGLKCVLVSELILDAATIELLCEIGISLSEYDDEFTECLVNGMTWIDVPSTPGLGVVGRGVTRDRR